MGMPDGTASQQSTEQPRERIQRSALEGRIYGIVLAMAALLGGFVAVLNIVDFVDQRKTRILLISAGVILVALPVLYIGYFVWSGRDKRLGFILTSLLAMTGVAGYSLGYGLKMTDRSAVDPGNTLAPIASTPVSVPTGLTFKFDEPADGAPIHGVFPVSGTVQDLRGDALWLFDYSGSANSSGLVYYRTNPAPIPVESGHWSTTDGPVGSSSDPVGSIYTIVLVRASPACSTQIQDTKPNAANDVIIGEVLPPGCSRLGAIHVKKA
jgi:hypothetical protein